MVSGILVREEKLPTAKVDEMKNRCGERGERMLKLAKLWMLCIWRVNEEKL